MIELVARPGSDEEEREETAEARYLRVDGWKQERAYETASGTCCCCDAPSACQSTGFLMRSYLDSSTEYINLPVTNYKTKLYRFIETEEPGIVGKWGTRMIRCKEES
jgi:hypothetical protein